MEPALSAFRHENLGMVWTFIGHFPSCGQSFGYYLPSSNNQKGLKRSFIMNMTIWHGRCRSNPEGRVEYPESV